MRIKLQVSFHHPPCELGPGFNQLFIQKIIDQPGDDIRRHGDKNKQNSLPEGVIDDLLTFISHLIDGLYKLGQNLFKSESSGGKQALAK